ncbi:response regulator [Actinacidiphila acidipaludis]|uniref:Response regulator transcription factor n=1 Tax=Actinacidiphila acidipaludis TaxID=2873382 RepID=A0ABS7QAI1_9ACTN|nr:response regulator transcription factor [Streptomyces acidipaludis]MBY8880164.1 response regulator transcription factor [Streptomyces acidipaludis]
MTIRVVLADDQPLVRAGLRALIADAPGIEVAGEAGTGREAVTLTRETRPDVVLMDLRLPDLDGVEATRIITGEPGADGVRVLVLSTVGDGHQVYAALRAGASGFVVTNGPADDVLTAIRVVAAGDALVAPSVTRRLVAGLAVRLEPSPAARASTGSLTERERAVLILVGHGLSDAEIAAELNISLSATRTEVTRLTVLLAARDRVHLLITAHEAALVPRPA